MRDSRKSPIISKSQLSGVRRHNRRRGGDNAEHATHTTYINAFMRETRSDCGTFFFGITEEEGEFLDGGHGNVSTVVAGQKGLRNAHQAKVSRQFSSHPYISKPMLRETGRGNWISELTLPLRSRKNKADAMVWKGGVGSRSWEGKRRSERGVSCRDGPLKGQRN